MEITLKVITNENIGKEIGGMYSCGYFENDFETNCYKCGIKLFIDEKDKEKSPICFECNLKNIVKSRIEREVNEGKSIYNHYKTYMILQENGFVKNDLYFEGGTASKFIKSFI